MKYLLSALLFAAGGPISGFEPGLVWWGQGKIGPLPLSGPICVRTPRNACEIRKPPLSACVTSHTSLPNLASSAGHGPRSR